MDIDLLPILALRIPSSARARAERCVETGEFRILGQGPQHAEGMILSEEAPVVRLRVDTDGDLLVACTCDAPERGQTCEHLWALAYALQQSGHGLEGVPGHEPTPYFDSVPASVDWTEAPVDEVDDEIDDDILDILGPGHSRAWIKEFVRRAGLQTSRPPTWQRRLTRIEEHTTARPPRPWTPRHPTGTRLLYGLDVDLCEEYGTLEVDPWWQKRVKSGEWGKARPLDAWSERARAMAGDEDQELLDLLGLQDRTKGSLAAATTRRLARRLCDTGRLFLNRGEELGKTALTFDDGPPWVLGLRLGAGTTPETVQVTAFFTREKKSIAFDAPGLRLQGGLMLLGSGMVRWDARGAEAWIDELAENGPFMIPATGRDRLEAALLALPGAPRLEIDGQCTTDVQPRPHLQVGGPEGGGSRRRVLPCRILFDYEGTWVAAETHEGHVRPEREGSPPIRRDLAYEEEAITCFVEHGGSRPPASRPFDGPHIAPKRLHDLILALLAQGWTAEAEGMRYRQAGTFDLSVTSGIDWFDLEGVMDFEGQSVALPALLEAARQGSRMVTLGDGSKGLLPETWLHGWDVASAVGSVEGEGLRFKGNQGWLLDALLAGQDEVTVDAHFEDVRKRLRTFQGIQPARQPRGFKGTLRAYQLEGLAWLRFLMTMGLGGCLADDMGLGKTVQVLALLEGLRAGRTKRPPSLVVAPRSVIFNWREEAARFAPKLRVLDYTGQSRKKKFGALGTYDLILTTYGTLRRDITKLKDVAFDLVILDEAQAIKNARSQAAKAARLLQTDHRLALSGTPIENHLGELWSLFEFLNPGMLGRAKAFQEFLGGANGRVLDVEARMRLAASIRPFILRRTKEQVLPDLPPRTDQVLHCEMEPTQRREYDRIREHFRASLLGGEASAPPGQTKLHVLEALLRLRQAACHLALLDPKLEDEPSAKLDALLPMLEEVAEGGHKALVFSQFTKFLAVVRKRLDALDIPYAYLDGRTRDRKAKVDRFQEDPDCRAFLISLKAGGLGLNLTAADYVFILDPWWNPAVEQQAVDRAHRIGQERPVMAYRLVCKDTVEEKVLTLQAEKQELADALLAPDSSILKTLTREDLELLLS